MESQSLGVQGSLIVQIEGALWNGFQIWKCRGIQILQWDSDIKIARWGETRKMDVCMVRKMDVHMVDARPDCLAGEGSFNGA
jgi:hypothetical protein